MLFWRMEQLVAMYLQWTFILFHVSIRQAPFKMHFLSTAACQRQHILNAQNPLGVKGMLGI